MAICRSDLSSGTSQGAPLCPAHAVTFSIHFNNPASLTYVSKIANAPSIAPDKPHLRSSLGCSGDLAGAQNHMNCVGRRF